MLLYPSVSSSVHNDAEIARLSAKSESDARSRQKKTVAILSEDMLKEIQNEANRQDRSLSWVVQQAWRIARSEIKIPVRQ